MVVRRCNAKEERKACKSGEDVLAGVSWGSLPEIKVKWRAWEMLSQQEAKSTCSGKGDQVVLQARD